MEHEPIGNQLYFYHWVKERQSITDKRDLGLPKPWTDDPILQAYRFCSVRREDDKVTKWIKDNWRDPFCGSAHMPVAMCIARLFNRPETLKLIGFPAIPFSMFSMWLEQKRNQLKEYREAGNKIFTGAYLVSTNGHSMDKIDYILDKVVAPLWLKLRHPTPCETLESYHAELMRFDGMGSFMAGQVIADLKYTRALLDAPDWWTWAPIGPGSKRGLNRYFGRNLEAAIKPQQLLQELALLQNAVTQRCGLTLPAHDIQNCLCEYDKYERVRLGEGKPRSIYNGKV